MAGRPPEALCPSHWGGRAEPHLQVPVDDKAAVHVLQAQDDLGGVEAHIGLGENSVLGQVVVQVPAWGRQPHRGGAQLPGQPPGPGSTWGQATHSPFMRSRMKLSLSGVWNAYDMQTMNGQS